MCLLDAPNVVGLVYIAALGLDEGESIGTLLQQGPPTPAVANVDIDSEGFAWLPEDDEVIPPDAERQFAQLMGADTTEIASGHCALVSHPVETHERIVTATNAAAVPA